MCGIAAVIQTRAGTLPLGALGQMVSDVQHRGPDGEGTVFLSASMQEMAEAPDARVGLGHRRLSIIDLSDAARQPMRRGQLWLTYNGELYNFVELRAELEKTGAKFETHSDTEVILAAYEAWGTRCFERFKGMWGLVLVDGARRQAIVSRDRLGIKPLYIHAQDGWVAFSSEIKQLKRVNPRLKPNTDALTSYLATGYEDQSRTFFAQVAPLPPGTWAAYSLDTAQKADAGSYWHPERVQPIVDDADEAAHALLAALRLSVKQHLRSDVPVGCALSGGLDSSAVAALTHELEPKALKTFTATFPGLPIDEQGWARQIVPVVNAQAHYVTPTAEGFLEDLDRFVWLHDEPVGHLSQYAAWCVARLTREQKVPVTLNGQGGDEVLSGYWQSYLMHLMTLGRQARVLRLAHHLVGTAWGGNPDLLGQFPVMARRFVSRKWAARGTSAATALSRVLAMNEQERRVFEIREMYLPRLLKWDDRNFMAFSVEGRYPFLDHEVIELTLSFSPRALYDRGWLKEPLRRALTGLLPETIVRRRSKLGFETPQQQWLSGPLGRVAALSDDSWVWQYTPRRAPGNATDEAAQETVRLFLADRWLRRFF
ncbi:MAG: asparagine synthase (glutamine-hydrolyzing) [Myxococcaceae bacterium]|nr:asparagine synthase (glutamine-hydrolyzing) [Myxococcaceae bacterium]